MGCPGNTGIDVGFGDKDRNSLEDFLNGKKRKHILIRWYSFVVYFLILAGVSYFFFIK